MIGDRQELRQSLYRLAAGQAGFFTARDALDLGYSYQAQKYHVDNGNWVRVQRGIFRIPEWPAGINDDLVRWVLWSKRRGVVSHDSAAAAYGFGVANPARTHLTVPSGFRMNDPRLVLHIAELPASDVTLLDGVQITTALRTVLDVAETNIDEEYVESVVDDALDSGLATRRRLVARLHELEGPGRTAIHRVLERRAPS